MTGKFKREKTPDILTGKKYTEMYKGYKYYFGIYPGEVFISGFREKDQKTAANLDLISRLVSMCLTAYPLEDVLDQLNKASRSKKDIPGILHRLLKDKKGDEEW